MASGGKQKTETEAKITPLQSAVAQQLQGIADFRASLPKRDEKPSPAAGGKKKRGGGKQVPKLQAAMEKRRRDVTELYGVLHPDRAASERDMRKAQARASNDFGHKRNGTVETHAKAKTVRQGALARLHASGAISIEQLGWALEITAEHERIDADVSVKTFSYDTRVDITCNGDKAFFESLGRVRRSTAYTRWRAALPSLLDEATGAQHLLELIVDDLGITWAAKRLRMSVRRTRKVLIDALELWPTLLGEVKDDIGKREWLDVYARLAA